MEHVWLIGMMGSGKTSVGRALAEHLECPFYDTDATVAANAGMSVDEIFDRFGEPRFREFEARAVQVIASQDDGVVSTGGGVVLNPSNVEAMRASGRTVLLDVDTDTIVARLGAASDRPLVSDDPDRRLREIASAREGTYRMAADVVVDALGSIKEVAHRVEAACIGS
ncbi:MAG: shikimate kinase [Actinomycetia bacterium]|nr:shikimate kinase [Actinomycetes bacterium]